MSELNTTFELVELLPQIDQNEFNRIKAIPSGQRSAKDAAWFAARLPYQTNQVLLKDTVNNLILIAAGNTVPTSYTGFRKGALFIDLSTNDVYANQGDETSATWANLTSIGSSDIAAGAVGTTQLAANAVTAAKLASALNLSGIALTNLSIEVGTPVNAVAATGIITSNNTNVSDGDTVVIGGVTYTFKTALTDGSTHPGEILIGADADTSLTHLESAIKGTGTPGTDYDSSTPVDANVTCSDVASHAITLTAKTAGIIGNNITLTKVATTLTLSGLSGGKLSGGVDGTVGTADKIMKDDTYLYFCLHAGNTTAQANWRRISLGSAY